MVDYGKWDRMAADMSDEEDEDDRRPRVTTFAGDQGRSVVIGPSGAHLVPQPSAAAAAPAAATAAPSSSSSSASSSSSIFELSSRNGGVTARCTWCQDRLEAVVRKELPAGTKASDIAVTFDREGSVLTVTRSAEVVLHGTVRYKFELNDDELCPVPWELVTIAGRRVLEITLKKLSPIPGAVIWWKHVFVDDPEIDVTAIPDRARSGGSGGAGTQDVANAWEEAHRLFKERAAAREPITIDVDEEEDDEEEEGDEVEVAPTKGVEGSQPLQPPQQPPLPPPPPPSSSLSVT